MKIWQETNAGAGVSFVIANSPLWRICETDDDAARLRKIARCDAIEWLKNTNTEHHLYWSDWDDGGGDTHVVIPDESRRALFKLQFALCEPVDYRP